MNRKDSCFYISRCLLISVTTQTKSHPTDWPNVPLKLKLLYTKDFWHFSPEQPLLVVIKIHCSLTINTSQPEIRFCQKEKGGCAWEVFLPIQIFPKFQNLYQWSKWSEIWYAGCIWVLMEEYQVSSQTEAIWRPWRTRCPIKL